jgi:hypothetical protein
VATDPFVPLLRTAIRKTMDRRPAPSPRPHRRRQALRAVVPMAAETGAGATTGYGIGTMKPATIDNEKFTEDPKFRWLNNRGDNLSKRVKNRTGGGKKGTSKLCPRRRGKFQSSKGCSAQSSRFTPLRSVGLPSGGCGRQVVKEYSGQRAVGAADSREPKDDVAG